MKLRRSREGTSDAADARGRGTIEICCRRRPSYRHDLTDCIITASRGRPAPYPPTHPPSEDVCRGRATHTYPPPLLPLTLPSTLPWYPAKTRNPASGGREKKREREHAAQAWRVRSRLAGERVRLERGSDWREDPTGRCPPHPPKRTFALEKMSQLSSFARNFAKRKNGQHSNFRKEFREIWVHAKWGRACLPRPSEVLTRM